MKAPRRLKVDKSKEVQRAQREAKEAQREALLELKTAQRASKEASGPGSELRNELKLLVLKHAEAIQLSEAELKKELTKAAKVKENDLPFEVDKYRLKIAGSWTKGVACSIKNGTGLVLDKILGGQGCIAKEFRDDLNLEHAIHSQTEKIAFLMDPRVRIGLLTAKDVVQGYAKKMEQGGVASGVPNTPLGGPLGAPLGAPFGVPSVPPRLVRQNAMTNIFSSSSTNA